MWSRSAPGKQRTRQCESGRNEPEVRLGEMPRYNQVLAGNGSSQSGSNHAVHWYAKVFLRGLGLVS